MADGRKTNRPPLRKPSLSDEAVAVVDQFVAMGVMQMKIAEHMDVSPRTIMAVVNRKGAYARIPQPGVTA